MNYFINAVWYRGDQPVELLKFYKPRLKLICVICFPFSHSSRSCFHKAIAVLFVGRLNANDTGKRSLLWELLFVPTMQDIF